MSGSVDTRVSLLHFCKTSLASFPFESFLTSLLFLLTGVPLKSDCLGNVMRVSLDRALEMGSGLEVEAVSEYRIRQNHEGALNHWQRRSLNMFFFLFPTRWHPIPFVAPQLGFAVWLQHGVRPLGEHADLHVTHGLLRGQQSTAFKMMNNHCLGFVIYTPVSLLAGESLFNLYQSVCLINTFEIDVNLSIIDGGRAVSCGEP